MRVLICDDESDIRLLYRSAFQQQGADVVVAHNGDECVRAAEADQPDMVVLDLMMPVRDGFSTLAELHGRWPSTMVYIVSAFASPENFMRRQDRLPGPHPRARRSERNGCLTREGALYSLKMAATARPTTKRRPARRVCTKA
ncbi:MAG: response regulator [Actinobacteria bacterium]|nr:MAG: response regulator [Actinomycetota bacterium]